MKSIVIEDKSLHAAVDKALKTTGNPKEFQIKIIKEQEGSFFLPWKSGFCKIIFSYEIEFLDQQKNDSDKSKKSQFCHTDQNKNQYQNNQQQQRSSYQKRTPGNNNNFQTEKKTHSGNVNLQQPLGNNSSNNNNEEYTNTRENNFHNKERFNNSTRTKPHNQFNEEKSSPLNNQTQYSPFQNQPQQQSPIVQKNESLPHNNPEEITLWSSEQIEFITNWICNITRNFNLSSTTPIITHENNIIKISMGPTLFSHDPIRDKHLSSSLVVMLYETIRSKYSNNNAYNNNKIIIIYE